MSFTHLLSTLQTKSVLDCTANNHQNIRAGIEKDAYLREEKQQRPYTTPYTQKKKWCRIYLKTIFTQKLLVVVLLTKHDIFK